MNKLTFFKWCYFRHRILLGIMRGSWRGGRIPISQPKFWLKPIVAEHKSHHLSGCPAQILIPFPFSIVLLLMNPSSSAWNPKKWANPSSHFTPSGPSYEHFESGSQATVALIMLILTVKSKSWVLENQIANTSNIFLHILYYNYVSHLYMESLKTQKNQTYSFARFFDKFCFGPVIF
jgi:hypothetical protein